MSFLKISLFVACLALTITACQPLADLGPQVSSTLPSPAIISSHREYAIHQLITLANQGPGQPDKQNLWVALVRNFFPYQQVLSTEISPREYTPITDEYGNQYAEFDLSDHPPGTTKTIRIDYRMVVNELAYDLSGCRGELIDEYIKPELNIESANPQIVSLASELARDKPTLCQQVRSFYDYLGNHLVYSQNHANWGAQAALGEMGADCTEYTALLVALSRAQKIPARYFEGLLYSEKNLEEQPVVEHTWPDVYFPSLGWVALDPTLGRSSIDRETYFAHYTSEHIILTLGANPSTLRGGHYWTHLYWPGNSAKIVVEGFWKIEPLD
jgi:transglutaminase-like putative cysteine protease